MNNNRPTMLDDWMHQSNPSPRTLFANFLNDDFSPRPFPDPLTQQAQNPPASPESESHSQSQSQSQSQELSFSLEPNQNSTGQRQSGSSNGGLAERMQARAGFNVPKLNTSRFDPVQTGTGTSGTGTSNEVRSPYLMIPPGLSPTSLLDSPVFLSNLMVQPSPTTGKLPFLPSSNSFGDIAEAFSFKPCFESKPSSSSFPDKKDSPTFNQSFSTPQNSTDQSQLQIQNQENQEFNFSSGLPDSNPKPIRDSSPSDSDPSETEADPLQTSQDEDGYSWRKYGQKQVKNSENPRSYYKCVGNNCPVKKKVERNLEGQVTEIIYKGSHNHPKPLGNANGTQNSNQNVWQQGQNGNLVGEMQVEGQGQGGGMQMQMQMQGQSGNLGMPSGVRMEGQDGNLVEVSSNVSNEEEDRATHGGASVEETDEDDGQETDSKRRKLEACAVEINAASRAVREPRVVVQTTSEVDILDDGYRWRKYGQKVVKGNPNPRSYYKCTNPGCSVRKHVERASHDLKSVITTYEGRHNHEVPAARNSNAGGHAGSGAGNPGIHSQSGYNRGYNQQPNLPPLSSYSQMGQMGQMGQMSQMGGFGYRMGQQQQQQQVGMRGMRMPGPGLPPKMGGMNMNMGNMNNMGNMMGGNMGSYMGQGGMDGRYMMQKGEVKEESMNMGNNNNDNGFRVGDGSGNSGSGSNQAAVYQQMMMNRMNMGGPRQM